MGKVIRHAALLALASLAVSATQGTVSRAQAVSTLPWMNATLSPEQRADLLIAQMTLEQKVQQLSNDVRPAMDPANRPSGCGFQPSGRHIQGIPALGIPTVRMTNGGVGLRGGDCQPNPVATGVPSALAAAATFNPDLNRQLGDVLGNEARLAGHQVLLGPSMNLVRHPYGGRNYQSPSEDPYLSGVMAAETIAGIQANGIHAVAKHYAGNEQETQRKRSESLISSRALHELYLLPFEMSVKDGQVASVMCSYNRLNGISSCSNDELLDTTLRQQWGFLGYVITDRSALHDLAPSIKAGVDWELSHQRPLHYSLTPQGGSTNNPGSEGISAALQAGSITMADIDQMLRRRYIEMFRFGQFDTDFDTLFAATPDFFSHGLVAREIAQQGIVLLKNQNNVLPLDATTVKSVALIGATWYASVAKLPFRGTFPNAPYTITPKKGLENVLRSVGSLATVTYESGGGTGTKADRDKALDLARKSDVVIVMVGDDPREGCDRQTLRLPIVPPADLEFCGWDELKPGEYDPPPPPRGTGTDQEALMADLTGDPAVAQKMVVVLKTEGTVLMPWLDKVPALLEAWYPGQEDGNVVANVLFGLSNPSGKLPVTFGNSEREAAFATTPQFPGVWSPPPFWSNDDTLSPEYIEGLQVGYRWYEANRVAPVFPFGFGLSYTTFAYSGLSVARTTDPKTGHAVVAVTYTIANTGSREGAESSQVYVTLPPAAAEPSKRLVGFKKVDLAPGASQRVTVTIDPAASNHPFSYWVPVNNVPAPGWSNGSWSTAAGNYTFQVGGSSADTPLVQTIALSSLSTSGGTAGCTSAQPGANWVCVNGGWRPPGSPGAGGTPTPTPTPTPPPSSACTTTQPGANWVCVNGGWKPPGSPGAGGTPTPTPTPPPSSTCTTPQPGANWVCVNGGWRPPGSPGAGGTPTPTPPPSSACTTTQPGANWVCVNGGWRPPGSPGAGGTTGLPSASLELLMENSAQVAAVRESLQKGETRFQAPLAALERDANDALKVSPVSVMQKRVTPPSGDKHDYMSQAPYWWPNPDTRNGRPYVVRDGKRNPEIDRITDHDNLFKLSDAVFPLALAYHLTGRQDYAQHAAELVRVWFIDPATRMNPNLDFAQGIPGIARGRPAGIIESRRLPNIIDAVTLLQGSGAWSTADNQAFTAWMRAFLQWLRESPNGRADAQGGNNQETWYDLQVAALAAFTGQTGVARATLTEARSDIGRQFQPSGRQPRELARTRAWDYSIFNLTAFVHLAALGDRLGVDLWNYSTPDGRSLRKGIDFLVPFATRDKPFPFQQISEFRPSALTPILRWAAVGLEDAKYRALARQIGGGSRTLELIVP